MAKYHKFYVPQDLWDLIVEQSAHVPGTTVRELAKQHLRNGVFGTDDAALKSSRKKISKTISTEKKRYRKVWVPTDYGEGYWIKESVDPDKFFNWIRQIMISGVRCNSVTFVQQALEGTLYYEDEEVPDEDVIYPGDTAFNVVREMEELEAPTTINAKFGKLPRDAKAFSDVYELPKLEGMVVK